ncbi:MAG: cell division protein FtsA [bacterium]|nr:cell division protein FtsA [bacterium]
MSFFFNTGRAKEKLAVIFDIGSGSVGAALVGFISQKPPKIFYTTRKKIQISKNIHAQELLTRMTSALKETFSDIEKEGFPHVRFTFLGNIKPDLVFYVLASPWHISQVRFVRKKESRPFRVEADLLGNLVHHELTEFLKAHTSSEITENKNHTHELIEGDILDVELNRYSTKGPIGKVAHDIGVTVFATSAPTDFVSSLRVIGERACHGVLNRFASFTFAFFTVVRDIWNENRNYFLLDISGEVTDLSVVKDGKLLETRSFPFGSNTVIRLVASRLGLTILEAESLLATFFGGHLSLSQPMRSVIKSAENQWTSLFSKELTEVSSQILLPHEFFLTADEPYASWFKEIIESEGVRPLTPTGKSFSVVLLDGNVLAPYCSFAPGVYMDPFLIIESIFLNRKISMV